MTLIDEWQKSRLQSLAGFVYCLFMESPKLQELEVHTASLLAALMRYERGNCDPAINYEALQRTVALNLAELERLQEK